MPILYNPEQKKWVNPDYSDIKVGTPGWVEVAEMGQTEPSKPTAPTAPAAPTTQELPAVSLDLVGQIPKPPSPPPLSDTTGVISGIQKDVETFRTQYETALKEQLEALKTQQQEAQKRHDEYLAEQKKIYAQVETLTSPFREELEKTERQRLSVEENFFANQKLVNELDTLLTQLNTQTNINQELLRTGAISRTKYEKDKAELLGRAGVIQSVMTARNEQIGVAKSLIDRTVNAINADRTAKIGYLESLLNFYGQLRSEEGKKIDLLTSEQKKYLENQINLIKSDMEETKKRADYIKDKMVDPATAQAFADAGVTLNDTEKEINKKLADYAYAKEIKATSEAMAKDDWTPLLEGQTVPKGAITTQTIDSRGKIRTYYKIKDQWSEPYLLGGDYVQKNLKTGEIRKAVDVAKTGVAKTGTLTERVAAAKGEAISKARDELEKNIGTDGYVDPKVYSKLRTDFAEIFGDASAFDKAYSVWLSPQERARLGVGKAVGVKAVEEKEDLPSVIKKVEALKAAGASFDDIKQFIVLSGYDPSLPEFKLEKWYQKLFRKLGF